MRLPRRRGQKKVPKGSSRYIYIYIMCWIQYDTILQLPTTLQHDFLGIFHSKIGISRLFPVSHAIWASLPVGRLTRDLPRVSCVSETDVDGHH